MESEATLIRAKCRIELYTVSSVDLHLSLVVLPSDSELYHALRNGGHLKRSLVFRVLLEQGTVLKCRGEFYDSTQSAVAHTNTHETQAEMTIDKRVLVG